MINPNTTLFHICLRNELDDNVKLFITLFFQNAQTIFASGQKSINYNRQEIYYKNHSHWSCAFERSLIIPEQAD